MQTRDRTDAPLHHLVEAENKYLHHAQHRDLTRIATCCNRAYPVQYVRGDRAYPASLHYVALLFARYYGLPQHKRRRYQNQKLDNVSQRLLTSIGTGVQLLSFSWDFNWVSYALCLFAAPFNFLLFGTSRVVLLLL